MPNIKPPKYDAVANHYDKVMSPLETRFFARLRARVFAELPEDARLLEIGAGTGVNFKFYPHGTHATASELSFKMLELARDTRSNATTHLIQNCAEKLPFKDDSFDAAVATLVFCSVDSPQDAFAELRRVVRSGGTIALLEHVRPNGLLGYLFDVLSIFTVAFFDDHINRRTAYGARRAGLEVIACERHALGIVNIIICKVSGDSMSVQSIDDVIIRAATNQDKDKVIALVFSVLTEFGLPSDPNAKDADLNDIEGNYIQPGGAFEVLEDQHGNLIGTVGLYPLGNHACELRKMYFVPRIRGKGLGKRVLERMIAKARQLGFTRMQLETKSVLEAAVHIYKTAGFVPIKTAQVSARCDQIYSLELTE